MRKLPSLLLVAAALMLAGCVIVPVPMAKKIEGPKGTIDNVDRGFLQAGVTHRDEVDKRLASIDLGLKRPELFWGRFESSSAGVFAAAWLEPGVASVNKSRVWGTNNMLITFDASGVATGSRIVPDRHIDKTLVAWLASHETPQVPVRIKASHYHADTTVGEGEVVFDEHGISFAETKRYARVVQLNGSIRNEEIPNGELDKYEFKASELIHVFGGARDAKAGGGFYRALFFKRPAAKKRDRKIFLYASPLTPDELLATLDYARKNCPAVKYTGPKW